MATNKNQISIDTDCTCAGWTLEKEITRDIIWIIRDAAGAMSHPRTMKGLAERLGVERRKLTRWCHLLDINIHDCREIQ